MGTSDIKPTRADKDDLRALRAAIKAFASEHRACRFGVLREVGAQAALSHHVKEALGKHRYAKATVVGGLGERAVKTERVRLESKILPSGSDGGSLNDDMRQAPRGGPSQHLRTDMILYRRKGVQLVQHANGPGDVLHRSHPEAILAAVEIKADPSRTVALRKGYGRDIARLLGHPKGIRGFFVLLDKSSVFYGPVPAAKVDCRIQWEHADRGDTTLDRILRGNSKRWQESEWKTIVVSRSKPEDDERFVEIYNVSVEKEEQMRYYAYRNVAKAKRLQGLSSPSDAKGDVKV